MKDDFEQLLKSLHLRKIAEIFDEEAKRAEQANSSYQEFTARLLRAQWQANQEAALAWSIRRAGLPEQWTLESFLFKRQPGVNQRQIRTFAELEFVPKAENIVFIGPTGVGKTGLASALLLKALQNGHRGVFMRAQDLFDEMYASIADRSTRRLPNRLAKVDVLVIDEMGYLNLRPEQTNIFFKLMEERYRQRATIITINQSRCAPSSEKFDGAKCSESRHGSSRDRLLGRRAPAAAGDAKLRDLGARSLPLQAAIVAIERAARLSSFLHHLPE